MTRSPEDLVLSYLALRRAVGVLGMALPCIVIVGAWRSGVQDSISAYYHTNMGDAFVGLLFAIGVFMASYHGYDFCDDLAGDLACLGAVGVALFPTDYGSVTITAVGKAHYSFAALLFAVFAAYCLWLFPKSKHSAAELALPENKRKRQRNWVYRVCGVVIVLCMVLMFIGHLLPAAHPYPSKFWLETIAIEAFGFSWLTKGEAILGDKAA